MDDNHLVEHFQIENKQKNKKKTIIYFVPGALGDQKTREIFCSHSRSV